MNSRKDNFVLEAGDKYSSTASVCWWVMPHPEQGSAVFFHSQNDEGVIDIASSSAGILAIKDAELKIRSGTMTVYPLDLIALAKIQAFIDTALKPNIKIPTKRQAVFLPFDDETVPTAQVLENWLIRENVTGEVEKNTVIAILRSTEWYWLVSYLLNYDNTALLKELGEKYGFSQSHFRRLTKLALGNTTKGEMCRWRLTKALFDLIETNDSITAIALNNGYASVSHFSSEFKNIMGFPPRELKKLLDYEFKRTEFH
ncbi:AraC-like DNA-binding protein [Pantoea alhagi]|uniref:helix-turn-helix domain-containing protein n=1 Tax=Mixta sp. BE291 TaxID=3158787 RepID=UPI00285C3E16|nr:AraC-like DNA-binding protein [Pantoea alhagi]